VGHCDPEPLMKGILGILPISGMTTQPQGRARDPVRFNNPIAYAYLSLSTSLDQIVK